jgi:EAL and modified HD-GYP domain-containing signal transduction protein
VSVSSLIRAKFCETIASDVGLSHKSSELFMMGMFSMIDVLIGRPMDEVLEKMNFSQDVKNALLGVANEDSPLLKLITSYEMADWDAVTVLMDKLSLNMTQISQIYQQSVAWADGIFTMKPLKK